MNTTKELKEPLIRDGSIELSTVIPENYVAESPIDPLNLKRAVLFLEDALHHRKERRKQDPFSLRMYEVYHTLRKWWFYRILVLLHLSLAFIEYPQTLLAPSWIVVVVTLVAVLGYVTDLVFKRIFLIEGEEWRDPWSYVLVGCIILTLVDLILWPILPVYFRIGQLIRPLFLCYFFPSIRTSIRDMKKTLVSTIEIFVLMFAVIFIFLLLFVTTLSETEIGRRFFKNYFRGFTTLFAMFGVGNYPDVMLPTYNKIRVVVIPFIVYLVVMSFFMKNLLLWVVYADYRDYTESELHKNNQLEIINMKRAFKILANPKTGKVSKERWIQLWKALYPRDKNDKLLLTFKLIDEDDDGKIGFREFSKIISLVYSNIRYRQKNSKNIFHIYCAPFYTSSAVTFVRNIINHWAFSLFADAVTLAYAVFMAISFNAETEPETEPITIWELILLIVYITEIVLKIFASGVVKYFRSWWNRYDCFLVCASILTYSLLTIIIGSSGIASQIFRALLILRVVRLLRWFGRVSRIAIIIQTVLQLFEYWTSFAGALGVLVYLYAIIGMHIWLGAIYAGNPRLRGTDFDLYNYYHFSFNNFFEALSLLFVVIIEGNWAAIAEAFERVSTPFAWIFFCSFYIYTTNILVYSLVGLTFEAFVVQWKMKRFHQKSYLEARLEELEQKATPENDHEGLFFDEFHVQKQWKITARYNVTQALKTVFGDLQIEEEECGESKEQEDTTK
jgi:hypothetical protein